jgi:TRAP transporter TAXI family solute receptor
MKRNFALVLILVLAFTFALTGCAAKTEEPAKTDEPAKTEEPAKVETLELAFATGGTSGTYYPLGGAIASVWNTHIDGVNVTIQPAGASVENINRVSSGEVDIVMAMNNIADQAMNGVGESFPKALDGFKAVGVIYPEVMHVITTQKTGITSIADLKGKTINPGPPGSGTYVTAMAILEAYGIGEDDFKSRPGSFSDAVAGLKDGNLDAGFAVVSFPASAVTQIATTNPVKILEITGEGFDNLLETVPFAAQFPITGGVYKGQDEDAITVALQAVLYVKSDLSDELVYNLAKVMYENTPEIEMGHARGGQISIDNAINGITTPFHPGALKYLEEMGKK